VAAGKPAVAYIGVATESNHIRKRLLEHIRESSNWALARIQDPLQFRIVFFPCDTLTAHQIETYVITHRKPPFNVRPEYRHLLPSIAVH
jgi:ribosomal protein L16/L10AE